MLDTRTREPRRYVLRGCDPGQHNRAVPRGLVLHADHGRRHRVGDAADDQPGGGHGERPRSQLLLNLAGAENMLILAVNSLAVNGALHALYRLISVKSVLYTPYTVRKCLTHPT